MPFPPVPNVPSRMGCLDDADFAADGEANAEAIKALVDNGNRAKARGALMFRQVWNVATTGENQGGALAFAWPFWHLATPVEAYPVFKKPGLTTMRFRVRGELTNGARMLLQVATRARPFTQEATLDTEGNVVQLSGSGSFDVWTRDDMHVHPGSQEIVSVFAKGLVDPDTDTALVVATYGGPAGGTGTVTSAFAGFMFVDNTLTGGTLFNTTGSQVHTGGHYVIFRDAATGDLLTQPKLVTDVVRDLAVAGQGLMFAPAMGFSETARLVGSTYEIYQLPSWRAGSMVAYSADGSP